MTEQKPHKWEKEIVAWAGGAKIERRRLSGGYGLQWDLFDEYANPAWNSPDYEFRIYDPYRKLREAQGRGEVIEEMDDNGIWRKASDWAVSRGFKFEFNNNPDRYRIAKPAPKEEDLYVLVSERDPYHDVPNSRPIIWEQYIDNGEASLDSIKRRQERIGDRHGKTRIAKLQFTEE